MSSHRRASAAVAAVLCLLFAACTSQTDEPEADGEDGPAGLAANNAAADSTVGITEDSINVAFVGVDFSALAGTGLVPELGDQEAQVTALVEEINEEGGIGGRQINLHFELIDGISGGQDVIQAACIAATEEFEAAVAILPPAAARVLTECTAVTNQTLTIYATGMDDALYGEADGRLFTPSGISIDRQLRAQARAMDDLGVLDDETIGVVSGSNPPEFVSVVEDVLIPELEQLGHDPAEVITVPCEQLTTCEQYDATAQRLKDAGVTTVFMNLANTFGAGLVEAATNIDYHPRWLMEGNQTTDTVSGFFESVKDEWDGAVGLGFAFSEPEDIRPLSTECNEIVTTRSGEEYEAGTDAFGFTAQVCSEFRLLDLAGDAIADGEMTQGALISAMEELGTIELPAGPEDGTISPTKHDGLNFMYLCDYSAAEGFCVRRPDEPIRVDD